LVRYSSFGNDSLDFDAETAKRAVAKTHRVVTIAFGSYAFFLGKEGRF
jgi:hypothetical protein